MEDKIKILEPDWKAVIESMERALFFQVTGEYPNKGKGNLD